MATKKNSRSDRAVFSKLNTSLARVMEEMDEMNLGFIDIPALKIPVEAVLVKMYSDLDSAPVEKNENNTLMILGEDDSTCPLPLARSIAVYGLLKVLDETVQALKTLESVEDKKLYQWAKKMTSEEKVEIDFENLLIINPGNKNLLEQLDISWMVLDENMEKLRNTIGKFVDIDNPSAQVAYARDLGLARIADKKIETLLRDLWDVTDAATIDEVMESVLHDEVVKPHVNPIRHFADILKQKLSLPIEDQEELMTKIKAAR